MKAAKIALLLLAAVALAGCATSRSQIDIKPAHTVNTGATAVPNGKTIVIRNITDERKFEENPKEANIPSLGFGGAASATEQVKARAFGRKRNTFGKALGDVLLPENQSVTGLVRENLTAGLQSAGYTVKDSTSAADKNSIVVDVHIKQFWSWIQPGFWAITLNANIETDITTVSGNSKTENINVHSESGNQVIVESDWAKIIEKSLQDYQTQVISKAPAL